MTKQTSPARIIPIDPARIDRLSRQYREHSAAEKEAKDAKDAIGARISSLLKASKMSGAETDDYKVTLVSFDRETIDKTKLAGLGVRPSIIKKATTVTPVSFPKITDKAEEARKAQERQAAKGPKPVASRA